MARHPSILCQRLAQHNNTAELKTEIMVFSTLLSNIPIAATSSPPSPPQSNPLANNKYYLRCAEFSLKEATPTVQYGLGRKEPDIVKKQKQQKRNTAINRTSYEFDPHFIQ